MGDVGDDWNAIKEHNRSLRERFGVPCPHCRDKQPKREPSILLPQQVCRVDGYRDPRPRIAADND